MSYDDPQGIFSFSWPIPASNAWAKQAAHGRPGSSLVLRSSFSVPPAVSCKGSEGLAPFQDRGRLGAVSPTCRPRSFASAKRETRHPQTESPRIGEKTGRSIRCPARIRPLRQARTGFEPNNSGRAPALHALEYLTTPAFEDLSLPFRSCEANAAALVGRWQRLSSSDVENITRTKGTCQENL
jgi:hypothetical protein